MKTVHAMKAMQEVNAMEMVREKKDISLIFINMILVLVLLVVIFPLLLIARYNYPSADDWSFSAADYQAVKSGGGISAVLFASIRTAERFYKIWEGRFCISLLGSLQPGIWGEKYYGVVAFLMIGILIFAELFLCGSLCKRYGQGSRWLCIPIVVPSLIMQILYTPSPVESFYWYNGAVNYTFIYGLSLILLAEFLAIGCGQMSRRKLCVHGMAAVVLAILIGGNNFSASLSSLLTLVVLSGYFLWKNKQAFFRTWYIPALIGAILAFCVAAPGVNARLNANFDGKTGNAVEAIVNSLKVAAFTICAWSNLKILLMLLLILPFLWMAAKDWKHSSLPCHPALFTLLSFGVYASMFTPNLYVEGSISSGRLSAVLYYAYHVWLVGNVGYWIIWLHGRQNSLCLAIEKTGSCLNKYLLPYCSVLGMVLAGIIYVSNLRQISSYRAYRDYRQGWAQQYAAEWEKRLEILRDDSIKEVEFAPLSVYPEMLLYTDLQEDDGYTWVNSDCAAYYGKTSIRVVAPR